MHHDDLKRITEQLLKNSVELLARVSVIEEHLLNNKMLMSKTKNDKHDNVHLEKFQIFITSNDFPLKSLEQLNSLESKLNDVSFKKATVSIFLYTCMHK